MRRRILERAGGEFDAEGKYLGGARCEQCHVPDQQRVERGPGGTWQSLLTECWHDSFGHKLHVRLFAMLWKLRTVRIVLTVAHLNHVSGDNRDENLAALCQWCHLHYDAEHHKESRSVRKDKGRPLLG